MNAKEDEQLTNQEKIQHLRSYGNNGREITRIQDEILRWESLSCKMTVSYGDSSGSSGGDKLQTAVEKIAELQERLIARVVERVQLRDDIEQAIATIQDEQFQQLLRYRYIDGWTWERIAVTLAYDVEGRNIYKLHSKAIDLLKIDTVLHTRHVI